uniref:TIL domain-containing protein n=1 Tax=Panagrolaimus davidi TaxID=227884 RepID=A0A914PBI4_9BILA
MKPILYLFISICILGSTFARTPLLKCSENEALASCPGCEPSCKNPNPICPMICREGQACQCSAGFVRNDAGKCVRQTECSATGGNSAQCKENETLKSCPGCEPSCKNPNPICPMMCRLGQACQCSAGFVRNDAGKCVQQTECSTTGGNSTTQCKENETLKSCPGCEKTCANPNPVCIQSCREGQECECSEGFVRNDAGKCVKLAECPSNGTKQCKENETLKSCPGCEKTCANPNVCFFLNFY